MSGRGNTWLLATGGDAQYINKLSAESERKQLINSLQASIRDLVRVGFDESDAAKITNRSRVPGASDEAPVVDVFCKNVLDCLSHRAKETLRDHRLVLPLVVFQEIKVAFQRGGRKKSVFENLRALSVDDIASKLKTTTATATAATGATASGAATAAATAGDSAVSPDDDPRREDEEWEYLSAALRDSHPLTALELQAANLHMVRFFWRLLNRQLLAKLFDWFVSDKSFIERTYTDGALISNHESQMLLASILPTIEQLQFDLDTRFSPIKSGTQEDAHSDSSPFPPATLSATVHVKSSRRPRKRRTKKTTIDTEVQQIKCQHCGESLRSGWKLCPTCGEAVQQLPFSAEHQTLASSPSSSSPVPPSSSPSPSFLPSSSPSSSLPSSSPSSLPSSSPSSLPSSSPSSLPSSSPTSSPLLPSSHSSSPPSSSPPSSSPSPSSPSPSSPPSSSPSPSSPPPSSPPSSPLSTSLSVALPASSPQLISPSHSASPASSPAPASPLRVDISSFISPLELTSGSRSSPPASPAAPPRATASVLSSSPVQVPQSSSPVSVRQSPAPPPRSSPPAQPIADASPPVPDLSGSPVFSMSPVVERYAVPAPVLFVADAAQPVRDPPPASSPPTAASPPPVRTTDLQRQHDKQLLANLDPDLADILDILDDLDIPDKKPSSSSSSRSKASVDVESDEFIKKLLDQAENLTSDELAKFCLDMSNTGDDADGQTPASSDTSSDAEISDYLSDLLDSCDGGAPAPTKPVVAVARQLTEQRSPAALLSTPPPASPPLQKVQVEGDIYNLFFSSLRPGQSPSNFNNYATDRIRHLIASQPLVFDSSAPAPPPEIVVPQARPASASNSTFLDVSSAPSTSFVLQSSTPPISQPSVRQSSASQPPSVGQSTSSSASQTSSQQSLSTPKTSSKRPVSPGSFAAPARSTPSPTAGSSRQKASSQSNSADDLAASFVDLGSGESKNRRLRYRVDIELHARGTPDDQNNRCAECGDELRSGFFFSKTRYCEYSGKYFCDRCHEDDRMPIPAKILHRWDTKAYSVSLYGKRSLESVRDKPVFNIRDVNAQLYRDVADLKVLLILRQQLKYMHQYITTCSRADFSSLLRQTPHLWTNPDLYSYQDLLDVSGNVLFNHLQQIYKLFLNHIVDCPICYQKGTVCEVCRNDRPIFAFQLKVAIRCKRCKQLFHRGCFNPEKCPKCLRNAARALTSSGKTPVTPTRFHPFRDPSREPVLRP